MVRGLIPKMGLEMKYQTYLSTSYVQDQTQNQNVTLTERLLPAAENVTLDYWSTPKM